MRLLVATNMWPSATDPTFGIFVKEQVDSVRSIGIEVDVAFVDGRSSKANYVAAVYDIGRRLSSGEYDVVHAHYVLTGLCTYLATAGRERPPIVVTHHGVEVFTGWQAPLARWLTDRVDRTLVVSRRMADRLRLGGESVVPCGVDLELFRPGPKTEARNALGLDREAPLVGWVGVDRPEKRLDLARAAVDKLRDTVRDARLHVVSGVAHREVPLHLQACDLLLVTSSFEGGPLVAKEALACNRPVVSTDVGDVPELIAGLPGCAVAAPQPAELAVALERALESGDTEGRERVRPYSVDQVAERLGTIYAELATPSARARADG
jgi:glycosyltransferase involved in cell wall biosynthesis